MKRALHSELLRRSPAAAIAHVALAVLVYLGTTEIRATHPILNPWVWGGTTLILLNSVFRFWCSYSLSRVSFHNAAVVFNAFVWFCISYEILDTIPLSAPESTFIIVIISGLASGASASLSPSPRLAAAFISFLCAPTLIDFWNETNSGLVVKGLLPVATLIYVSFLIRQMLEQNREIQIVLSSSEKAQDELKKVQEILDSFPGYVSYLDEKRVYRAVNRAVHKDFSNEVIVGKPLGHQNPDSNFTKTVEDFISSKEGAKTLEIEIEVRGKKLWHLLSLKKMEQNTPGTLIVATHIGELKDAQALLERQRMHSQFSERLASLGEMAGNIAHEINNPMAIIQGSADQIIRYASQTPPRTESILTSTERISKMVARVTKIVRSLRKLSRDAGGDELTIEPLSTILDDVFALCEERAKMKNIKITLPDAKDVHLSCASVQISQVLVNLVSNAIDALDSSPATETAKEIRVTLDVHKKTFILGVFDNGPGIPPEVQPKILNPFFTTKPVGKGTGLGLSISDSIIKRHGGRLWFESKPGNTTFFVELLLASAAKAA